MASCARCGQAAKAMRCPGDGGSHRHGMVHVKGGGLDAVCPGCWMQVWQEWNPTTPREQMPES